MMIYSVTKEGQKKGKRKELNKEFDFEENLIQLQLSGLFVFMGD